MNLMKFNTKGVAWGGLALSILGYVATLGSALNLANPTSKVGIIAGAAAVVAGDVLKLLGKGVQVPEQK